MDYRCGKTCFRRSAVRSRRSGIPSQIRHRRLKRRRSGGAISALTVALTGSSLTVVPAEEQAGRHHVQGLEVLLDTTEHLLKVRQHRAGELVDQEGPAGMEKRVRLPKDLLAHTRRNGRVWNTRDDVVCVLQIQGGQGRVCPRRGTVDNV